jgi:hypothetical protein
METKIQNQNQNQNTEGEKPMATKAYTKEMVIDLLHGLDLKMEYKIDTRPFNLNVFYFTEDGYRSIEIDLQLEMDMEASMEYRKRHHNAIIYNIKGFELSVISLRTSDAKEAELLLMQYQEAMQVVHLFKEISEGNAVLIENL